MGWRGLRYAFNPTFWNVPRVNSIKISIGLTMVVMSLNTTFRPDVARYKASNSDEQLGMWIAAIVMIGAGLLLLYSGITDRKKQPAQAVATEQ
jgi:hypothetical protein